jgi:pimeloyl-ACP methyl ester carboxylesterase
MCALWLRRTLLLLVLGLQRLWPSPPQKENAMSMRTDPTAPDTIVLINGLWMTALSWENWVKRYEDRGYRVIARS